MAYFTPTGEVDRVQVDEGHWVDIKRRMSYGDNQRLVASYMRLQMQLKERGSLPSIDLNVETGNITLLMLNIVAWNLTDEHGKEMPVIRESIERLDNSLANKLVAEINAHNPPPKA